MSFRLRLNLLYKDGTAHELLLAIPPDIAEEIAHKGLMAAQIFVDKFVQIAVPDNAALDTFKKG